MNQTDRFCAEDNKKLIEHLKNKGIIKSPLVFKAMCLVDRKKFVNKFNPYNNAYIDAPQNIGHGRTISAPHMHGMIFEILSEKLTTAKNVLCIRCSTGYVSNCMSIMMGPYGTVIHIESIPELKEKIKQTIENAHPYLLWGNRIKLLDVENESAGYPQPKVRYDVIYVGAAAAEIPQALIDQLAYGGRLVIPIGPKDLQQLMQIDKNLDGTIMKKTLTSVRYGYLDSPREITNANNNTEIKAEKPSNEKSVLNLNSKNFNNTIIRENIQTQSPTKIQISSPTKPAQDHFNGCVKIDQTITEKLDTKIDEKNAPLNVKKNDDLPNFEKIREKSIFDTSGDICLLTSSHKAKETGSSIKMQTASLKIPMQNDSNSCIKDEVTLQVTKEKLQIESHHSTEQLNSKTLKENVQKACQELVSLEKKVESRKDNLQNVQKIDDIKKVSNLELNSELETASDKIELETTMDELMATHANKTTVENIEQPHQKKKLDKSVEILKTNLKVESLQNLYVDDILKKLTLLLDKKLATKIDENLNVKIGSIERRIILLEDDIKKFNDIIKQEANEQKIFLCEMDKALKIKIEKLRNKIGSVEKDNKITERKLSNKIVRVKECMDEKIIDEVEELSKRLKMIEETNELFEKQIEKLSIAFEERLLKEKADIYMQIDAELEKKEQRQLDSVKSNISCLDKDIEMLKKKLTNKETNNKEQYCFIAFHMIITLHATYALFKNLS